MKKIILCLTIGAALVAVFCAAPAKISAADADTNKQILKDALVGAVTGAAAVEGTKDTSKAPEVEEKKEEGPASEAKEKKSKDHKSKEGHRPPGWDKGKKTGWQGADVPPGQQKSKNK